MGKLLSTFYIKTRNSLGLNFTALLTTEFWASGTIAVKIIGPWEKKLENLYQVQGLTYIWTWGRL